jgi:hypothetical protein
VQETLPLWVKPAKLITPTHSVDSVRNGNDSKLKPKLGEFGFGVQEELTCRLKGELFAAAGRTFVLAALFAFFGVDVAALFGALLVSTFVAEILGSGFGTTGGSEGKAYGC